MLSIINQVLTFISKCDMSTNIKTLYKVKKEKIYKCERKVSQNTSYDSHLLSNRFYYAIYTEMMIQRYRM